MPCRSAYDDDADIGERQRELDKATRVACELGKILSSITSFDHSEISVEAQQWLAKHAESDRRRLEAERLEKKRMRLRADVLKKLTPAERRLLGL